MVRRTGTDVSAAEEPQGASGAGTHAVLRAFDLLNALADCDRGLGLSDLVAKSGVSMATAHRIVKTLEADGYIRQYVDRTYSLGPRMIEPGRTASALLPEWTGELLQELVDKTGETANLAVLDADEVVYIAQIRSRMALQLFTAVGSRLPAHCTAVGKALLANLPNPYIHSVLLRTGMPPRTPATMTDPALFLRQINRVRRTGYATDIGEQEAGVNCVAVPVSPAPRNMAISISGPSQRVATAKHAEFASILRDVAERVAAELNTGPSTFEPKPADSVVSTLRGRKVSSG